MPNTNHEKAVNRSVSKFHFLVAGKIHPVILNNVKKVWKTKKKIFRNWYICDDSTFRKMHAQISLSRKDRLQYKARRIIRIIYFLGNSSMKVVPSF